MRYLFILLFVVAGTSLFSQEQPAGVCYILFVKGEIKKATGEKLVTGDTLSMNDIASLKFVTPGAMINFFESNVGSFRMTEKEIISPKAHHRFFDFLGHLLKVKGHPVSLSARGDCICADPKPCLASDTSINHNILLIDNFSFRPDDIINKADRVFYFIQYGNQKRRLKVVNGSVEITVADLIFKDTSFTEGETPEFKIGLYIKNSGIERSDHVANARFNIVSIAVLQEYYKILKVATQATDLGKLKENFTNDVYLYFGKPTPCQLDLIINSINE